jgi:hypothetical protein
MLVSQRRRDTQQMISLIARCDPLDGSTVGWSRTSEADAMVRRIAAGELTAAIDTIRDSPSRRPGRRPAIMAVALLIVGASVAAAAQILGGPAPSQVKQDLANVDQGMPSDLRYNPDVRSARLVAQADGASLYYAMVAKKHPLAEQTQVNIRQHALEAACFVVNATAWLDPGQQAQIMDDTGCSIGPISGGCFTAIVSPEGELIGEKGAASVGH